MRKECLRVAYQQRRVELTGQQRLSFCQHLTSYFFGDKRILACLAKPNAIVHTYLPIKGNHEVDTWPLIHQLWRDYAGVCTWSSITDRKADTLLHFELTPDTLLTESTWGIPMPSGTYELVTGQPDLVIIPLLAFDLQGHRIGYGGGYYDRFLAQTSPSCLKIGLSFFQPVDRIEDIAETDVRLDGCICPERVYWF